MLTELSSATILSFPQPRAPSYGFLALPRTLLRSTAWQSLSAVERCIYIEIADRHNGKNNGVIPFSGDDGAKALRITRKTVKRALAKLMKLGLIKRTKRGHFNVHTQQSTASRRFCRTSTRGHQRPIVGVTRGHERPTSRTPETQ